MPTDEEILKQQRQMGATDHILDRMDQISMFLEATQPRGYDEYYNPRRPLLGKELSVGNITREDMLANDEMVWAILECFIDGQIDIAWDLMTWYQNDWKASMSIDGKFLESLMTQEFRYTQTQHLYEHEAERRRGMLGRRRE